MMYYRDHLAAAVKEISARNFCVLVDVAVSLFEEKRREEKGKSKVEESKSNIINGLLGHIPKRKRSTVTKFVPRKRISLRIHDGASTSSSLPDLNLIPEEEEPSSSMKNPPNPNSSDSSSCLSLKRKRWCANKVKPISWKGREIPKSLVQLMEKMKGDDLRLIFEKVLEKADCDEGQSRLLMPFNTLICNDFLTPVELRIVEEKDEKDDDNVGVGSILIDQRGVKWGMCFRRRDMKKTKTSGKASQNYALISGWVDMVKANGLKRGDSISVWSFRWSCGILCFAIVPSPTH